MTVEIWKPVVGFEEEYEVSSFGNVRARERPVRFVSKKGTEHWRIKKQKAVATQLSNAGYLLVHLHKDNTRQAKTVHSLVAAAFLGPRPDSLDVCHNNGRKTDNRAANLRYDTRTSNHADRVGHGTIYDGATAAKLTPSVVKLLRAMNDNGDLDRRAVAKAYGVTEESIRRVIKRESWKYVA